MAKLTLTSVANLEGSGLSAINANFDAIEAAFENTVSRDGTAPNEMLADLDLNTHSLLNATEPQITGGSVSSLGPMLEDFGARTTQVAGAGFDSGVAVQNAFNAIGALGNFRGNKLGGIAGNYRIGIPLSMRHGTHFYGAGKGKSTVLDLVYTGTSIPFRLDGSDGGLNDWVYDSAIESIFFECGSATGSYTRILDIVRAYSLHFTDLTLGSVANGKTGVKVGECNDLTFDRLIVGGQDELPLAAGIALDSSYGLNGAAGEVRKVHLLNCDFEVCTKAITATCGGSTSGVKLDVTSIYTERCNTGIYWDAGGSSFADESRLVVMGGNMEGANSSSIGVDIRRSHATIMGLSMGSAGAIGVDIDNATTYANCHLIGGNLHVTLPYRDTNGRLTTNSYL